MSATPVYDYDLVRRLMESGATISLIAERIGAPRGSVHSIICKLKSGHMPKQAKELPDAVGEATEIDFADEARTAARLRKSCEAATAALIAAYPERVVRT